MKFNPTHKTNDGIFEVEINANKGIELALGLAHAITVFNTQTQKLSVKKIYHNKKGLYFNGNNSYWHKSKSSRYYLHELLEVKENERLD